MFAHAVKRLHGAFLRPSRLHDVGPDLAAVKVKTYLQVLVAIREFRPERKHDRELGTLNDLHVRQGSLRVLAVGLVFVKSIAINVDRHAHSREMVCAHCGGEGKLLGERSM
jgi:hypothetical protein